MKRMIVLLALTIVTSTTFAQHWTKVTPPFSGRMFTPYFLNPDLGFVFNDGIVFSNGIYITGSLSSLMRTTDGGRTWVPLRFFDSIEYCITQLSFVTPQHGYASTYSFLNVRTGGIFETFDQGDHWKLISKDGLTCTGVYAVDNIVFVNIGGQVLFSRDDGVAWDSIMAVPGLVLDPSPLFQLVYGNRDSLVATVYYHPTSSRTYDTYLVFSTDQGQSWQARMLDQGTSWLMTALHISPHSCDIIRQSVNSQDQLGDKYSFLTSSFDYRVWNPSFMHYETGAWIAGNTCALYLSDASNGGSQDLDTTVMLFRSTDGGVSWQPLQKQYGNAPTFVEIDDRDFQNMSVVGHGATVYAVSFTLTYGSSITALWKTTDGGDGSLSASSLAPRFALDHKPFASQTDTLTIDNCSQSLIEVYNQNIACSYAKFDSISIAGLDPLEYSVLSTHHCSCQPMPDTSFITLQPKTAGPRDVTIHYHFTDDEFEQIDTSIHVTLVVMQGTSTAISIHLKSNTILAYSGDTIDIPAYLAGNAILTGSTLISLPFELDTNALRVIGFRPAIAGITSGVLTDSNGTETMLLHSQDSLMLSGETLIGTLRCVIYLSDTLETSVSLVGANIASNDPRCIALSTSTDAVKIDITGCGDSTLLQYMKTGQIADRIIGIVPNPASREINIRLQNVTKDPISYEIDDALGAIRTSGIMSGEQFTVDVSALRGGTYYVRVVPASGGLPSTRTLILER